MPTSGIEWTAFGLFLAGTVAFFAWVVWLAREKVSPGAQRMQAGLARCRTASWSKARR